MAADILLPTVPDKPVKFRDRHLNLSREIQPEAVGVGVSTIFFQDNFRPEVASDVVSDAVVEPTGMKVSLKFGDSRSNFSRDI